MGYAPTLQDALLNLGESKVGRNLDSPRGSGVTEPPANSSSSTSSSSSAPTGSSSNNGAVVTLQQVETAIANLNTAYKSGDPAKVGDAEKALKDLVARYESSRSAPVSPGSSGGSTSPPSNSSPAAKSSSP